MGERGVNVAESGVKKVCYLRVKYLLFIFIIIWLSKHRSLIITEPLRKNKHRSHSWIEMPMDHKLGMSSLAYGWMKQDKKH